MAKELSLRPYQKECIDIINKMDTGSGLVALPVGTGKCLAKGTKVLMKTGLLINAEDIKPGDVLMGPDSEGRLVLSTTSGKETMIRISTKDNEHYTVNKSHILSLIFQSTEECPLFIHNGIEFHNGNIVHIEAGKFLSLSKKERNCLYGYKTGVEFREKEYIYDPYEIGREIAQSSNPIIRRLYLTDCRSRRLKLLAGILDEIGDTLNGNFVIRTKDKYFRSDLKFLCSSLGLHVVSTKNKSSKEFNIVLRGVLSQIPTKKEFLTEDDPNALLSHIQAKRLPEDDYYGFELYGNDRRFVLGNFYVTHNTVIFSHIKRKGKTLILSHREELVYQPKKYFDCSYGVERAEESSNGEEVISASVQTLHRRLNKFGPNEFDTIITDEAHHAVAPTYQKIYDYFNPRIHIGFTATPNRKDKIGLGKIYDKILFERNLKWGIQEGYLCDINCQKIELDLDLSKVKRSMGDFQDGSLAKAIDFEKNNVGVAKAYRDMAVGQTVVFAVNVAHTHHLVEEINKACGRTEAVAVTGATPNRAEILEKFRKRQIHCIVNCMVLTEGTDLPMIETIIMVRPTQNESLLMQCIGRGTRKYPGKKELLYIDCVGTSEHIKVCGVASLLGMDESAIPKEKKDGLTGSILEIAEELEEIQEDSITKADQWIVNTYAIDLFSDDTDINTLNLNFTMQPDGGLTCPAGPNNATIYITPMNYLGRSSAYYCEKGKAKSIVAENLPLQNIIDNSKDFLERNHGKERNLWDMERVTRWGRMPATDKQKDYLSILLNYPNNRDKYPGIDIETLTKYDASQMIASLVHSLKPFQK